ITPRPPAAIHAHLRDDTVAALIRRSSQDGTKKPDPSPGMGVSSTSVTIAILAYSIPARWNEARGATPASKRLAATAGAATITAPASSWRGSGAGPSVLRNPSRHGAVS